MVKSRCVADDFLAVIQNDRFNMAHQHVQEKNQETGKQEQELGRSKFDQVTRCLLD